MSNQMMGSYNKWSYQEDEKLRQAVEICGEDAWRTVCDLVGSRDSSQCRQRWFRNLKPSIHKGKWSKNEDEILMSAIDANGTKWTAVKQSLPQRTAAQCRERWYCYLCPDLNRSEFTEEEDAQIISLQRIHGNRWSLITEKLETNRCSIFVRARYHALRRRKLSNQNSNGQSKQAISPITIVAPTISTPNKVLLPNDIIEPSIFISQMQTYPYYNPNELYPNPANFIFSTAPSYPIFPQQCNPLTYSNLPLFHPQLYSLCNVPFEELSLSYVTSNQSTPR